MEISVNLGYVYDVITRMVRGIIAVNNDYFIYYAADEELNDYIHVLYHKNVINSYMKEKNNIISFELVSLKSKSCLRGLSYALPYPYYIGEIICRTINLTEASKIIYQLFIHKLNEGLSKNHEKINKKG